MGSPDPDHSLTLRGTIERFTFRNPDTGFAVVRIAAEGGRGLVTAVGPLAQLAEGQRLVLRGKESAHPRFGSQFEVASFELVAPSNAEGIEAYLASGLVKGIGPATAKKIVAAFGTDTLRIIDEEPQRLRRVPGLGARKIAGLAEAVRAQRDLQNVLVFLRSQGLGQALATRIVKRYGAKASALVQANPYRLADELVGVGFRTADELAQNLGIAADAPERLEAALTFCLGQAMREGHSCLPELELVRRTAALLEVDAAALHERLPDLVGWDRVVRNMPWPAGGAPVPFVYPSVLAHAENDFATSLLRLSARGRKGLVPRPEATIDSFAAKSGMALHGAQREALVRALVEPVSVITGGPGVGKTTIVRALVHILGEHGLRLHLAAPTGRAAKRMADSTGHVAHTLHRLLDFTPGLDQFARNAANPLEGDMLVVDEASMLDIQLAAALLRAVPPSMVVVMIGDRNQLPSVGPGSVLADVLTSGRVPTTALTHIFRQKQDSGIVGVAHGILRGDLSALDEGGDDFFFVEAATPEHARLLLQKTVVERIPRRFGFDPVHDVQVLCPMYRGAAGADNLNRDLQALLNPGHEEIEFAGKRFRIGDKVLQVRNNYDREVWNGDIGRITYIDTREKSVHIRFPDREHRYKSEEVRDLLPAYAISVHRSQGSEYPAVVMPVTDDHHLMLRRAVLYTAITRGKKLVVLVGSRRALALAVRRDEDGRRYSGLADRLENPVAAGIATTPGPGAPGPRLDDQPRGPR